MRFLTVMFIFCACAFHVAGQDAGSASAARPYRELSTFSGDTIAYMKYNFEENKAQYVGHSLEKFIEDYELPYGNLKCSPNLHKRVDSVRICPWPLRQTLSMQENSKTCAWVVITFQQSLFFDMSPQAEKIVMDTMFIEQDLFLVAMKMKRGIIKDIYVYTY